MTSTTFKVGNYQQVRCSAETPSRNSAQRFSEATRNIVLARREMSKKISDYDKAVQMLTSLITQSFGVFKTEEMLEDGSVIYYLHNKPALSDSKTIWKMTADAFAVSTDGGKTWNAGMDSSGNAVLNVLSAIGISFDWAKGGTLTLGGQNNTNGLLRLLSAAGVEIARLSKDGLVATAGRFSGDITGASGNFTGDITGASGKFSGSLDAAKGTFAGDLSAAGGSFKGDFRVDGMSPMKYPIIFKTGPNAGDYSNAIYGMGGRGYSMAANGYYMYLDYEAAMPRLSGGTYSSVNQETLELSGADAKAIFDADGMIKTMYTYHHTRANASNVYVSSNGIVYRSSSSSKRYKKYGKTKLDGVDPKALYDLPVRQFKYRKGYLVDDDPRVEQWIIGFFAEEVEEIYPCAAEYENGQIENWNSRIMIPAMLKLIQEQHVDLLKHQKRIFELEEQASEQNEKISKLEKRLAKIEEILEVRL